MIDTLKSGLASGADALRDLPAVQRIVIAAQSGPQISLSFAAIALCLALVAAPIWGWWKGRERDQWWRAEIARTSAPVRAIVETGNKQAQATDDDVIKALGGTDEKLHAAEKKLHDAGLDTGGDCPVIPAQCVR